MLWSVDPASKTGLTEQIAAAVRGAVIRGELAPGELLPTSKELAGILGVNPNTVLSAYRTLREEQILDFRRGRGVRVREDADRIDARVLDAAREFIRIGSTLGYSVHQLPDVLRQASETP